VSQTRKKRRESSVAEKRAQVEEGLLLTEVLEAIAGEALADQREHEAAAVAQAEQEALIASTQEAERRKAAGFQLKRTVESMLFASDRPIQVSSIRQYMGNSVDRKELQECLDQLVEEYSTRGIVLHDVAGGYQFRTHPASSTWIQKLIAGRPVRLSRAQLDTLAIIAYRQPITRPEIDDIRGVDSGSTLKVLLDRNLLRILGKKEEVGRPLLYGTSKDFLEFFNLSELRDLPTLREFHELNDDGMAQVDKLGADIKGVDVGAVAAQAAAEREAARRASAALEEALADEKRQARAAAKAERLAVQDPIPPGVEGVEDTIMEAVSRETTQPTAMDDLTEPDAPDSVNKETEDEEALAANDETAKESEMAGRKNDTESDAESGGDTIETNIDNTRLDVNAAPDRDPDTILEPSDEGTSTEISAASPDLTVVDRAAAPETSTEVNAIGENSVLDSSSIEHTIPEATMADILPIGHEGAAGQHASEMAIDELTIVPSDSTD
jgi:segregation and condensation protein B